MPPWIAASGVFLTNWRAIIAGTHAVAISLIRRVGSDENFRCRVDSKRFATSFIILIFTERFKLKLGVGVGLVVRFVRNPAEASAAGTTGRDGADDEREEDDAQHDVLQGRVPTRVLFRNFLFRATPAPRTREYKKRDMRITFLLFAP